MQDSPRRFRQLLSPDEVLGFLEYVRQAKHRAILLIAMRQDYEYLKSCM